jgi:hypothetical protein
MSALLPKADIHPVGQKRVIGAHSCQLGRASAPKAPHIVQIISGPNAVKNHMPPLIISQERRVNKVHGFSTTRHAVFMLRSVAKRLECSS